MIDANQLNPPSVLPAIDAATRASSFNMASDPLTGCLLRTLAASKPGGRILELGTGTGMGTAWLLAGMDATSSLLTVDNDPVVSAIARQHLGHDARATFHIADGATFLETLKTAGNLFDLIYADTWPGKYDHLDEALQLLKVGGVYVVDDMLPQPNWPANHPARVAELIAALEQRSELALTKLSWSTGIIVGTKLG